MARKGRRLERLVQQIERSLSAESVVIRSPDTELDKATGKKRELDVSIRLKGGSTPLLIMIECREHRRPQGVQWIEQIASKRDGINAAKAVAVSSSGFTEGALAKASSLGIETRDIREIAEDQVRDWFQVGEVVRFERKSCLYHARLCLDLTTADEIDQDTVRLAERCRYEDDVFIRKPDGRRCSLATVHSGIMCDHKAWRGITVGKGKQRRAVVVNYPDERDRYQFPTASGPVDVTRVILDTDQWIERTSAPVTRVLSYMQEAATLAERVEFEMPVGSKTHGISFTRDVATGRVSVALEGGLWQAGYTRLGTPQDCA